MRCSISSVPAWWGIDWNVKTNRCQKMTLVPVVIFVFVLSLLAASPHAMAQNNSPTRDITLFSPLTIRELLAIPDVVGVYVGTIGNERQLCLKVMLARANPESERKIPRMIEGYRVVTEVTGEIEARGTPGPKAAGSSATWCIAAQPISSSFAILLKIFPSEALVAVAWERLIHSCQGEFRCAKNGVCSVPTGLLGTYFGCWCPLFVLFRWCVTVTRNPRVAKLPIINSVSLRTGVASVDRLRLLYWRTLQLHRLVRTTFLQNRLDAHSAPNLSRLVD